MKSFKAMPIDENLQHTEKQPNAPHALYALAACMLLSSLGTSIANIGLPTLAKEFQVSFGQVQWVVLAYLMAITTLIVSMGRLGDIFGRRRLLLAGLALFTVASILCALAPTFWLLIAARALQGLGAAIMMTLALALVRETVTKEKTGTAMGLLGTMSAVGTALGPSLGGVLLSIFGWQSIFFVNVPLGCLVFLLSRRAIPATSLELQASSAGIDITGTLLLAFTLGAYTLAMTVSQGSFGLLNASLLLAALASAGLFLWVEARSASPLIRLAIFRDTILSSGLAMSMSVSTVMMTTLVVGPFYLSFGLGLNLPFVGAVMSLGPIITAFSGVQSGRLVDRLGTCLTVNIGLAAMAVGCIGLATLPIMFGIAGYCMAIAVLTPGYALFQAANNTSVMLDVSSDQRGMISGLLSLSRNLGLITGASAMGAVFTFVVGTGDMARAPTGDIARGLQLTFTIATLLVILTLAIAVGNGIVQRRKQLTEHVS